MKVQAPNRDSYASLGTVLLMRSNLKAYTEVWDTVRSIIQSDLEEAYTSQVKGAAESDKFDFYR